MKRSWKFFGKSDKHLKKNVNNKVRRVTKWQKVAKIKCQEFFPWLLGILKNLLSFQVVLQHGFIAVEGEAEEEGGSGRARHPAVDAA